jgi:hypothetical protein
VNASATSPTGGYTSHGYTDQATRAGSQRRSYLHEECQLFLPVRSCTTVDAAAERWCGKSCLSKREILTSSGVMDCTTYRSSWRAGSRDTASPGSPRRHRFSADRHKTNDTWRRGSDRCNPAITSRNPANSPPLTLVVEDIARQRGTTVIDIPLRLTAIHVTSCYVTPSALRQLS